jgi:hypothetical protein
MKQATTITDWLKLHENTYCFSCIPPGTDQKPEEIDVVDQRNEFEVERIVDSLKLMVNRTTWLNGKDLVSQKTPGNLLNTWDALLRKYPKVSSSTGYQPLARKIERGTCWRRRNFNSGIHGWRGKRRIRGRGRARKRIINPGKLGRFWGGKRLDQRDWLIDEEEKGFLQAAYRYYFLHWQTKHSN